MYEGFFSLKEKPFNLTADPRYLYLSPNHREALANLVYGIEERRGLIVITGEAGTGKTTLLHTLLEQFDNRVKAAFVFYPKLNFHDFLFYVLADFGQQIETTATTAQYLKRLQQFLLEQHEQGEVSLLIVDEAQNLSIALLEEIRMLSNMETAGQKLLQIVLVGQPGLQRKLHSQHLQQLRQRIEVAYEMHPLSYTGTQAYIRHRCQVAGGAAHTLFTRRALKAIHAYSGGIPRLINIIAEHALVTGYAEERRRINQSIVRKATRDLDTGLHHRFLRRSWRKVATVLIGLLFLSTLSYTILGTVINPQLFAQVRDLLRPRQQLMGNEVTITSRPAGPNAIRTDSEQASGLSSFDSFKEHKEIEEKSTHKYIQNGKYFEEPQEKNEMFPVKRTMKNGENLNNYIKEIYGFSNNTLVEFIKKNNPHIKNIKRIKVGEIITFPALDDSLGVRQPSRTSAD